MKNASIWNPKPSKLFTYNVPSKKSKVSKMNMTWPQAKIKYPKMNPFRDTDRDGVPNWLDCRPFNKKKDSILSSITSGAKAVGSAVTKVAQTVAKPQVAAAKAAVSTAKTVGSQISKGYTAVDTKLGGALPGGAKATTPLTKTLEKISSLGLSAGGARIPEQPKVARAASAVLKSSLGPTVAIEGRVYSTAQKVSPKVAEKVVGAVNAYNEVVNKGLQATQSKVLLPKFGPLITKDRLPPGPIMPQIPRDILPERPAQPGGPIMPQIPRDILPEPPRPSPGDPGWPAYNDNLTPRQPIQPIPINPPSFPKQPPHIFGKPLPKHPSEPKLRPYQSPRYSPRLRVEKRIERAY